MNHNQIIRAVMATRGFTQQMLAERAGLKRQSNVGSALSSPRIRTDTFVTLLDAMGYEVIIRDKNHSNKTVYELTYDDDEIGNNSTKSDEE